MSDVVLEGNQWSISKRPQILDDVFGQDAIVKQFKNLASSNKSIPNALWFEGRYGCGKTTIAKIIAKTIQCKNKDANGNPCNQCVSCKSIENETFGRNTIMFNAGANGLVDAVRDLINKTQFPPMMDGNWVILIEEAQKLQDGGVQALLKTIETPRSNVYFIFTSMEEDQNVFEMKSMKNFKALKSRCRQFKVQSATIKDLMFYMKNILDSENIWSTLPKEFQMQGLLAIANHCNGSYRSAVQILEECIDSETYSLEELTNQFGIVDDSNVFKALFDIANGDGTQIVMSTFIDGTLEARKANFTEAFNKISNSKIYRVFHTDDDDYFTNEIKALASCKNLQKLYTRFLDILDHCSKSYFDKAYCGAAIADLIEYCRTSTTKLTESIQTQKIETSYSNNVERTVSTPTNSISPTNTKNESVVNAKSLDPENVTSQVNNTRNNVPPITTSNVRQVHTRIISNTRQINNQSQTPRSQSINSATIRNDNISASNYSDNNLQATSSNTKPVRSAPNIPNRNVTPLRFANRSGINI